MAGLGVRAELTLVVAETEEEEEEVRILEREGPAETAAHLPAQVAEERVGQPSVVPAVQERVENVACGTHERGSPWIFSFGLRM